MTIKEIQTKTNTVGTTLNFNNLNIYDMQTLIVILSIIMIATAIMMALTLYGVFKDKDKDGIPDWVEDVKADIKAEIKKLKK